MSSSGEGLPIARKLRKEGMDVKVYIHLKEFNKCYRNMIPKVGINDLKDAIDWADVVIFDLVRANEHTTEDLQLLKLFGLSADTPSVFGYVADEIKKTKPVIGASAKTEEVELDRYKGEELAKQCGFDIPQSYEFNTLDEGVKFLQQSNDMWVFKPNSNQDLDLTYVEHYEGELLNKLKNEYKKRLGNKIEYILQKKVEGILLSTECWYNGKEFKACNHTIEDKNFLTGDLGLAVGSMNNTVWMANGKIAKLVRNTKDFLDKAGYIGAIDANCIVSGDKIYFLEWSMRFGYDAIFALMALMKKPLNIFLQNNFDVPFRRGFASTIRISIPPYPYSTKDLLSIHAKNIAIDRLPKDFYPVDIWLNPEDKEFEVAGTDGIVGVLSAYGSTIKESVRLLYKNVKKIEISAPLQYRTDCGVRAQNDYGSCKYL